MAWDANAACKGHEPELFFPLQDRRAESYAQAICRNECPVIGECLAYALKLRAEVGPLYGVWAGLPANHLVSHRNAQRLGQSIRLLS